MKIALCFFGQPRFYESSEMRNFLRDIKAEDCEVDVYMHLWQPKSGDNFKRSTWSNIEEKDAKIDLENLKEKIEDIYEPFALEIDEERTFVEDPMTYRRSPAPDSPEIVHRMYFSQWRLGEMLKESGKEYDLVFRMRTDSAILGTGPLNELIGDYVWVPDNCPVMGWFNDNFSISSQENFLKLVEVYPNLDAHYQAGTQMNGEPMLKAQARKEGIENKIRRNRRINVGLIRSVKPLKIQGVWMHEELRHITVLE